MGHYCHVEAGPNFNHLNRVQWKLRQDMGSSMIRAPYFLLCSLPFQIFPLPWLCGQQRFVFPPIWLVLSEGITNFPLFFESKWIPPFFSLTLITFLYISITTTSHPLSIALPHSIYVVFFLPLLTASSITTPWRQNYLCSACISGAGLIPGMNIRLNT